MKQKIIILTLFTFLFINPKYLYAISQEGEELFWHFILSGDYKKAAEVGIKIGNEIPEYYFLSSICYHNIFKYSNYYFLKKKYLQLAESNSYLKKILEEKEIQNKTNFQIYLVLGMTKQFLPEINLKEARSYFNKSISINENNPYAFNYLSLINLREENLSNTIQYAEKAIKLKSDFPEPYGNLAVAYAKNGDFDKSMHILLDCFNKCPIVPKNHFESLVNLVSKSEIRDVSSIGYLGPVPVIKDADTRKTIINSFKNLPKHYLGLIEQYLNCYSKTEVQELLKDFKCPDNLKNLCHYIKARYEFTFGNIDKGDKLSQSLINNDFFDYERLFEIGTSYFWINRYDKAIQFYLFAFDHLDSLDTDYKLKLTSNLGACYLEIKDYDQAINWLNKALVINPEDPISLINLSKVYISKNDKSEAKRLL